MECPADRLGGGASFLVFPDQWDWDRYILPLLRSDAGAVEGRSAPIDPSRIIEPVQQRMVEPPPHTCVLPVSQAPPACHTAPAPQLLWEHLPGNPGAQHEENPAQYGSGGNSRSATLRFRWLGWEEWLKRLPQNIRYKRCCHVRRYPPALVSLRTLRAHKVFGNPRIGVPRRGIPPAEKLHCSTGKTNLCVI